MAPADHGHRSVEITPMPELRLGFNHSWLEWQHSPRIAASSEIAKADAGRCGTRATSFSEAQVRERSLEGLIDSCPLACRK